MVLLLGLLSACGGGSGAVGGPIVNPNVLSAGLVALPGGDGGRAAVRLFPSDGETSRWCVYRAWPDETIHVFDNCNAGAPQAVEFPRGHEGELLLFKVLPASDRLYLFTYDARRNVPSGRIPGVLIDGVDIWELGGAPRLVAETMPLGGFDNLIHAVAQPGGLNVCAIQRCFSVVAGSPPQEWQLAGLGERHFVDLVLHGDSVDALVRSADNASTGEPPTSSFAYAHARLSPMAASVEPISADCVPFRFSAPAGMVSWRCADTPADFAEILRTDLARMPHGGLIDLGASNEEGRIAWNQVYYLNGLMQLAGGSLPALSAAADWSPLKQRIRAEVQLLALRGVSSDSGYQARRYSLRRTPLVVALHLGRIATTLERAARTGHDSPEAASTRNRLWSQLWELRGTLEQLGQAVDAGQSFVTLKQRRSADFWCDGTTAPFNYLSAYVHGLLALRPADAAALDRAALLMQPILRLEGLESASSWRYWWAEGRDGWAASDGVSINTPAYAGYPSLAHISYRTMDAAALLRLHALHPDAVSMQVVVQLRQLLARGALLPALMEEFADRGEAVLLDPAVARRFARSAGPWELQSQVWALEQLASKR